MRIQKLLSQCGFASRRAVEEAIRKGQVTVNGAPASLGQAIAVGDELVYQGRHVVIHSEHFQLAPLIVLKYYKPVGQICTRDDPQGRNKVFDGLPKNHHWILVGRLDINTSGLLLVSNRGDVANKLMHPRTQYARVYRCKTAKPLTEEAQRRLCSGIALEDGKASMDKIVALPGKWYQITVSEGRNRLVRRLIEAVGTHVVKLKRIGYAGIKLAPEQVPGSWQKLTKQEIKSLGLEIS